MRQNHHYWVYVPPDIIRARAVANKSSTPRGLARCSSLAIHQRALLILIEFLGNPQGHFRGYGEPALDVTDQLFKIIKVSVAIHRGLSRLCLAGRCLLCGNDLGDLRGVDRLRLIRHLTYNKRQLAHGGTSYSESTHG